MFVTTKQEMAVNGRRFVVYLGNKYNCASQHCTTHECGDTWEREGERPRMPTAARTTGYDMIQGRCCRFNVPHQLISRFHANPNLVDAVRHGSPQGACLSLGYVASCCSCWSEPLVRDLLLFSSYVLYHPTSLPVSAVSSPPRLLTFWLLLSTSVNYIGFSK